jgi:alpha-glucosidase
VIVDVKRAAGLTAKRGELDGFAGAMTRLRGAYDAMQMTWPVSSPPDVLTEAMQTGDRLSYYPERAVEEIAHFHELLPNAQANLAETDSTFSQHLDDYLKRLTKSNWRPANLDVDAERTKRMEAVARAHQQADEAGR